MIKRLLDNYWKTKSALSSMTLAASGWNQGTLNIERTIGPMTFLYVYDKPTGWTWMCMVPRETFLEASEKALQDFKAHPDRIAAVRGGVAYLIAEVATRATVGAGTPSGAPPDWEQRLGMLLTAYAASTKTYEAANAMRDGGHFVVLNYRRQGEQEGVLRPYALRDTNNEIVAADVLQASISQVTGVDQQRHPEWFVAATGPRSPRGQ